MNVLITGSGAREHALAWRCMQSDRAARVFCAPGNAGTAGLVSNVPVRSTEVAGLVRFAVQNQVELAVLGDDASVEAGVGDALRTEGICVFGPGREAGRIESSKAFALELMQAAGIPHPEFHVFDSAPAASDFVRGSGRAWVVKADGLALGKGVVVGQDVESTLAAVEEVSHGFGGAARRMVLQEVLRGPEISAFGVTDGAAVRMLPLACDYKRVGEGDQGPNTGGMGAYTPPGFAGAGLGAEVQAQVMEPLVAELARRGTPYQGVIYAGLMLTGAGMRVLEFNARFGDPEAQALLPVLGGDVVDLFHRAGSGNLAGLEVAADGAAVAVVLASEGYPASPVLGRPVSGLERLPAGSLAFHAGTRFEPGVGLVTSGGRVITVVGRGPDLGEARELAYRAADTIAFEGMHRRGDIALREAAAAAG
ncbi:MAG: phosphoribosylamine--glycine ligase [Candidatus Dormibacteria bacterium]